MVNYTIRLYNSDNSYEDIEVSYDLVRKFMNGGYKPKPDNKFDCYKILKRGEPYWSGILKHYHDREEIRAYVWIEEKDDYYVVVCSSHRLYSPLNFKWRNTFSSPVPLETLEEIKTKAEDYIRATRELARDNFKNVRKRKSN